MQNLFSRKEYIYTVYQERSFSRAAQKLFISQPSLSAIVHQVEEEVGLPLFDRTCKPIRMTEAGMAYIRTAEEIRRAEQDYSNYISAVNNLQAGTLRIGSNQLFSSLVLPRCVSEFVTHYPKIQLDLVDANSAELEARMTNGQLDLIVDNRALDPAHFDRRILCPEFLLLAVPASFSVNDTVREYQLSLGKILETSDACSSVSPVPLDFFAEIPFILMTRDNDTRLRSDAIFRAAGVEPHILLEIDRLVTLYNFLSIGTAAAIVSDTLIRNVDHPSDSIVFYRLPDEYARREVYVHCKRNKYRSQAMERFVELLRGDLQQHSVQENAAV